MQIKNHLLYDATGKQVDYHLSPNHDKRKMDLKWLVIHFTAGATRTGCVNHFSNPKAKASAHLVIDRDGSISQCVPLNCVAWHAGTSTWEGVVGSVNRNTIGIELVNFGGLTQTADGKFWSWTGKEIPASDVVMGRHKNGGPRKPWQTYTEKQLQVLEDVSKALVQEYDLLDVIGHEDISPSRKSDPGPAFHMDNFRARLFGRHE